ncbi:2-oxo-4-hydroxy-4-carboxy-5-ureidoimidazoline decarboxylase [Nocardia yamanashiensis]|uniref:2-oxo-4-hydroxy-4-carboxy-5-ureidoimidazoline decarboxylase n=1 Tax=Nocardia yamanashiensis TaxID=209247 RepID=UPI000833868D|nr:2-oxo-4-hydroxy-4-carboxy-5-ureidoimidazoline decarboxylase [Nocardia yamanashiensis]
MLMHHGVGLDRFNHLSRQQAIHALYECCCNVTWAAKLADGRPYPSYAALQTAAEAELHALSPTDAERAFDSCVHEAISDHSVTELIRVTQARIVQMLGPEDGYPDY